MTGLHPTEAARNEPLALRLHGLLTDIGYLLAGLCLAGMGVLYCLEVVLRYFINRPTSWSLETVSFLMLLMTFLAVPHAVRAGMHIAVSLLADLYPNQVRRLAFIMNSIGLMVCAFIAYVSLQENLAQYTGFIETNGNLVIPKWWLTAFITYGFANSALWYLRLLCNGGQPIGPVLAIVRAPDTGAQA